MRYLILVCLILSSLAHADRYRKPLYWWQDFCQKRLTHNGPRQFTTYSVDKLVQTYIALLRAGVSRPEYLMQEMRYRVNDPNIAPQDKAILIQILGWHQ